MTLLQKSKITPDFYWNPAAKRYIGKGSTGFVKNTTVRAAIDDYIDNQNVIARDLAGKLANREITIAEWQKGMHRVIADTINANVAASKGGWAQMDAKARGKAAQLIKQQLGGKKAWETADGHSRGLRGFADDLATGKQKMDGSFTNRIKMYINSGRFAYEGEVFDDMKSAGMKWEENIRHATDSCAGCLVATAAGKVPIGTLQPVGGYDCMGNDKCTRRYS